MSTKGAINLSKDTLDRLEDCTSLSSSFWDEMRSQCVASGTQGDVLIRESALVTLAEEINLDPQNIAIGKVDFQTLRAHQDGNITYLPEIYARGSGRVRTSAHLLNRLEAKFGWRERNRVLRKLQVSEAVVADPDLPVSIQFLTDVCHEMALLGAPDEEFLHFGYFSAIHNYHSKAGDRFRDTRSHRELYERCFLEVIPEFYEKNSIYRIVYSDHDRIIVKVLPTPEVCDQIGSLWIGSRFTCLNRMGAIASIPGYKQQPFSEIHETRCIHRGDPACVIEVVYRKPLDAGRPAGVKTIDS